MSIDYFISFFLMFAASALFLWLLGAAAFYRDPRDGINLPRTVARLRACWLDFFKSAILFFPVHARFAVIFVSAAVFAAGACLFSSEAPPE